MDWTEDFDEGLLDPEALEYLIEHQLVNPARGITAQVKDKGLGSLSEKQLAIFKAEVVDPWLSQRCQMGDHQVEGHELIGLWMDGTYCAYHANQAAKDN